MGGVAHRRIDGGEAAGTVRIRWCNPAPWALAVAADGTVKSFMSERLSADRHVVQAFELLQSAVKHIVREQQMTT